MKDLSYYSQYLKNFLIEHNDTRANDEEFINVRSESAIEQFESCRRQGLTVDQAREQAIKILTQDLYNV